MAQPPKRMLIVSLLITLAIYGFEGFRAFTAGSNSEAGLLAALFCLALVGFASKVGKARRDRGITSLAHAAGLAQGGSIPGRHPGAKWG